MPVCVRILDGVIINMLDVEDTAAEIVMMRVLLVVGEMGRWDKQGSGRDMTNTHPQ